MDLFQTLSTEALGTIQDEHRSIQFSKGCDLAMDLALSDESEDEGKELPRNNVYDIKEEKPAVMNGNQNKALGAKNRSAESYQSDLPWLAETEPIEETMRAIDRLMGFEFSSLSESSSSDSSDSNSEEEEKKFVKHEEARPLHQPKSSGLFIHEVVVLKPKCSINHSMALGKIPKSIPLRREEPEPLPDSYTLPNAKKTRVSCVTKEDIAQRMTLGRMLKQKDTTNLAPSISKPSNVDRIKKSLKRSASEMEGHTSPDSGIEVCAYYPHKQDKERTKRKQDKKHVKDNKVQSDQPNSKNKDDRRDRILLQPPQKKLKSSVNGAKGRHDRQHPRADQRELKSDSKHEGKRADQRQLKSDSKHEGKRADQRELKSISKHLAKHAADNDKIKSSKNARLKEKFRTLFGDDDSDHNDTDKKLVSFKQKPKNQNGVRDAPVPLKEKLKSLFGNDDSKLRKSRGTFPETRPSKDRRESVSERKKSTLLESTKQNKIRAQRANFRTIYKEYRELLASIHKRAQFVLKLGDMLERKKKVGDSKMQLALKKEILALGEELQSKSFQDQKARFKHLESKLISLKINIRESKRKM